MRVTWFVVSLALLGVSSIGWSAERIDPQKAAAQKTAAQKAEDAAFANRMVAAALDAEARGDFASRERLLADAAVGDASNAAQWHRGLLNVGNKKPEWRSIDETIEAAKQDAKLAKYESVRAQQADSAEGHLAVAKWCLASKLGDQARAHLSRVLDFSPDHAAARKALGFERVGDKWLSPEELEKLEAATAAKTSSIQKHGRAIAALVEKMKFNNPPVQAAARAELLKLKDPTAVGAVEAALAAPDLATSKLLVEWMGQVDCVESSLVLTRYSLLHPEAIIRERATNELLNRPLHDFVPEVFAALSSPTSAMVVPNFDRQGKLTGYGQAFAREAAVEQNPQVVLTPLQRAIQNQPHLRVSLQNNFAARNAIFPNAAVKPAETADESPAQQKAAAEAKLLKLEKPQQDELFKQLNQRVVSVIARVSKLPLLSSAESMWKWWDDYNESQMQKFDPQRYRSSYATSTIPRSFSNRIDCFVAGTPVLTQTGPRPIEQIRAGDLVLNRDLESGELRWQPVLKATNRAPAPTFNISVDDETFRCSGGHLFWVSGTGWKKASELQAGDILHAAKSPVRIANITSAAAAPTFNLEVADSPNYFVGRQLILTHDVTPRERNRQLVPGQEHVRKLTAAPAVKNPASR